MDAPKSYDEEFIVIEKCEKRFGDLLAVTDVEYDPQDTDTYRVELTTIQGGAA